MHSLHNNLVTVNNFYQSSTDMVGQYSTLYIAEVSCEKRVFAFVLPPDFRIMIPLQHFSACFIFVYLTVALFRLCVHPENSFYQFWSDWKFIKYLYIDDD